MSQVRYIQKIYRHLLLALMLCIMLSVMMFVPIYYKASTLLIIQNNNESLHITIALEDDLALPQDTVVNNVYPTGHITTKAPSSTPTVRFPHSTKAPSASPQIHITSSAAETHTSLQTTESSSLSTTRPPLIPLFFTVVNSGFLKITENWILNLEAAGMRDYIVLCVGGKCYNRLHKTTHRVELANTTQYTNETLGSKLIFGSKKYWTFIWVRARLIRDLYLKLYDRFIRSKDKYNGLFFMDADVAITKNFVPLLQEKYLYSAAGVMYDMVLSVDCNSFDCTVDNAGSGGYCACFIFIPFCEENHPRMLQLLKTWMKRLDGKFAVYINNQHKRRKRNVNDQRALNEALTDMETMNDSVHVGVFNRFHFPSGWLLRDDHFRAVTQDTIVAIHANYIIGPRTYHEKLKLFRKYDRWMLPWEYEKDPLEKKNRTVRVRNITG